LNWNFDNFIVPGVYVSQFPIGTINHKLQFNDIPILQGWGELEKIKTEICNALLNVLLLWPTIVAT
jgi:hypothetical protein